MPRRWLVLATVLAGFLLGVLGGSSALAAHRHAHRGARCSSVRRAHGHAGSVRLTHRPSRRRRSCRRHAHRRTAALHHRRHAAARRHSSRSRLAGPDGACQDAELMPTPQDLDRIRAATMCLVNRERVAHGERALTFDAHIEQAAQAHTQSMVAGDYFDHVAPGGQTPLQRLREAGYIYSSRIGYEIGENIAWGSGGLGTPRAIVAAWMASPGHRANILDARFRDSAIGVSAQLPSSFAPGQPGGIYTQDFGVIITG
jgi:uncharacterized protein YkwD